MSHDICQSPGALSPGNCATWQITVTPLSRLLTQLSIRQRSSYPCFAPRCPAPDHPLYQLLDMTEVPKRKGGIRKRPPVDVGDEEDDAAAVLLREQIAERHHEQQHRKREKVLRAEVLAAGMKKIDDAQAAGLSQRETNDLLDTYVHEQIEEKGAGETHMEAFIREQMRKRLGQDADEAAATSSQMHPEDELYAVPSDLQGQSTKAQDPGAWATGIVEVALPVEYKMKNIEETEAAKRRLLHASRGTQDELQSPTTGPMLRRGIYPSGFGKLTALSAPPQTSDSYVADKMRDEWKAKKKKKRHV